MSVFKRILKKVIIYIVIFMIVLSNTFSYGYSVEEIGNAVGGFAEHIMEDYTTSALGGDGELQYSQAKRDQNPFWNKDKEETYKNTPWYFDCSSFATAMYNYVCGKTILRNRIMASYYRHNTY